MKRYTVTFKYEMDGTTENLLDLSEKNKQDYVNATVRGLLEGDSDYEGKTLTGRIEFVRVDEL